MMNLRAFLEHNTGSITQISWEETNGLSHVGSLKKNENKYREGYTEKLLYPCKYPLLNRSKRLGGPGQQNKSRVTTEDSEVTPHLYQFNWEKEKVRWV